MAVNVDTVYQRVLALANKEQRGYITPQDFNLFAGHAQLEILDQYFYDINQFSRPHGNDTEYSDMLNLLDEKLSVFKESRTLGVNNNQATLPQEGGISVVYKIGSVFYNDVELEQVNYNELKQLKKSPLAYPTLDNPVYVNWYGQNNRIAVYPGSIPTIEISYIRRPSNPKWGYVVVNEKALYNPGQMSVNFELHESEQVELVHKILKLAGVSIQKDVLAQSAATMEVEKLQQEKQ